MSHRPNDTRPSDTQHPAGDPAPNTESNTGLDTGLDVGAATCPAPGESSRRARRRPSVTTLAVLAVAGSLFYSGWHMGRATYETPPGHVTYVTAPTSAPGTPTMSEVYRRTANAVVNITVPRSGTGTGFFYSPTRIVTNAHVVTSSAAALAALGKGSSYPVRVTLNDGRTRTAHVIAVDTRLDLAVLATPRLTGVPVLGFATHPSAPGDPVAVLGHPFGQDLMMSVGTLSGTTRNSRFAESDAQALLLQTDAAVNPGNSGGPLLDRHGQVLGVVTLRPDTVDGRQVDGLALAIPGPVVSAALDDLTTSGHVNYPVLGVMLRDSNPDDAHPTQRGAVVTDVVDNSGADRAHLHPGDRIVALDDQQVASANDVIDDLLGHHAGQRVAVHVLTPGGRTRIATVTLGSR